MSKAAVQIRPASPMDSVNIVRLIAEGYRQTPAKDLGKLDEQRLLEYVTTMLRHAFVVVADQNGRILGTLGVMPVRLPWAPAVVQTETWFAVTEAYRTRRIPEQLLDAVEDMLEMTGQAALLGTQMLTPEWANQVIAKRRGYVPSRQTFLRLPATVRQVRKVGT